jgi:hypothetical protein
MYDPQGQAALPGQVKQDPRIWLALLKKLDLPGDRSGPVKSVPIHGFNKGGKPGRGIVKIGDSFVQLGARKIGQLALKIAKCPGCLV